MVLLWGMREDKSAVNEVKGINIEKHTLEIIEAYIDDFKRNATKTFRL